MNHRDATPTHQTRMVGYESIVQAVFEELGEAEHKLARWNQSSGHCHYWSRESIENALYAVLATLPETRDDG